ncbi:FeoC-like transcriptional regulator [Tropicimonas sp. TH_r6]|uniref:FeoC-like transcriptional regulator n=1 Tax=Tropicimonas sp. TH_r6 TaxID=3082085 RepID=UPI002955B572|nr:FeoC-like transcriptional regulator [Tropicimonas sp. TH_r6]MDV7144465.1 FeoC-like transcriptional regulator [Tropicimonas sp. TH_r6]
MLMEIRAYLERNGTATILDLSNHFRIAPDALRGMLDHWIRKGVIIRRDFAPSCTDCGAGHCGGCGVAASFEIYECSGSETC